MTEELRIKLNIYSKKPLSDQVQEEMRWLIHEGILHPGDQLPTVRRLAAQLRVNFNTVARAYRVLDQEGLIFTHQGRGTYVMDSSVSPQENAPLTSKEQAEQLVGELVEKAGRLDIPLTDLYQAMAQKIAEVSVGKPEPRRRKIRVSQKRRDRWLSGILGPESGKRRPLKKRTSRS